MDCIDCQNRFVVRKDGAPRCARCVKGRRVPIDDQRPIARRYLPVNEAHAEALKHRLATQRRDL